MESFDFLMVLAMILLSTKIFGVLSERVHMPQVVGALLVGILLGPSCFNILHETDFLIKSAEIGVIMLMFLAGLDTDLEELKQTGTASFVIALIGVGIPLVGGFVAYSLFFNTGDSLHVLKKIFIGVILTATSVSITVETLREMGQLKGKVGTAILGAAIIDDIIGIIILTFITSFTDYNISMGLVFLKIILYFIFLGAVGFIVHFIFKKMDKRYSGKRRIAIYGFSFCLIISYISERYFGIADITGAYFAGIILCNIAKTRDYIAKKINISSYMLFSPVFFASIGIKTTLDGLTWELLAFSAVLLLVAVFSKIIGCGLGAMICGFCKSDALSIGIGMVSRGEVALIMAQKGEKAGLLNQNVFPAVVIVVIVTTLITPILLKLAMTNQKQYKTQ